MEGRETGRYKVLTCLMWQVFDFATQRCCWEATVASLLFIPHLPFVPHPPSTVHLLSLIMASEREQWERVQTKTFTNWVNSHLIKRGRKISDLETDLRSGVELINLLEVSVCCAVSS
jgi:hypothetical protein